MSFGLLSLASVELRRIWVRPEDLALVSDNSTSSDFILQILYQFIVLH